MRGITALAIVLALLTVRQVAIWTSDDRLWANATRWAPGASRPLLNLAVDRIAAGDDAGAAGYLRRAAPLIAAQPAFDRDWATDLLEVNWAVIDWHAGRLDTARRRLRAGPPGSQRAALCAQLPTVCG